MRLVIGERGRIAMRTELVIRFGYGATVPWMTKLDDGRRRAVAGPDMVLLRTPAPLRGEDFKTVGEFTVDARRNRTIHLDLYAVAFAGPRGGGESPRPAPRNPTVLAGLDRQKLSFRSVGRHR